MTGFAGWFGGAPRADGRLVLERMGAALGRPAARDASGPNFGIVLVSPSPGASLAVEADVVCVTEGHFAWRDPETGERAKDHGPAAALITAYRKHGAAAIDQIKGAFSFVLFDMAHGRALAAVDRFGIGTLVWGTARDGALVVGSTTDGVRAHPAIATTLSMQSIYEYLYCIDRVPAPRTIFTELSKLAPAEMLSFERGAPEVRSYWQMPYRSGARVDAAEAARELRDKVRASVSAAVAVEKAQSVGTFLSGGLDSSTVTGLAAELIPGVKSFTIGFPIDGYDETYYAELAARAFRTSHLTYQLKAEDVGEILQKSVAIYDEPFANSSAIPAYYCAQAAREAGVEVMLAGDGGDELFAGNARYVKDRVFDHYLRIPGALRRYALEPIAALVPRDVSLPPLRKFANYVRAARLSVPDRMLGGLFGTIAAEGIFSPEALAAIDRESTTALLRAIYDAPRDASKLQRMMNFDLRLILADSDLRKVGRMCELAGVRVRYPFLDEDVAEFAAGLPDGLLLSGGRLRGFYKDAMKGFLPDEIIDKQKHGFGLPYFDFVTGHAPLRDLSCEILIRLRSRGIFRSEFLDGLVGRLRSRTTREEDGVAWDLLVLELWLESRA